jgi:simple sugar transport system substrate-binding protein
MTRLTKLLAACTLALIAGCGGGRQDDRIVLGFSQLGTENAWRRANTESIKSAAAVNDIDLRLDTANQNQAAQIAAIRGFIAQKVDVIAFSPVVQSGWDEVLREAQAAKIPVIVTDSAVTADRSLYRGFIGPDFVEEGRKAARWLVEHFAGVQDEINIVELQGTPGAAPTLERHQGFGEIIAQHPRFRIVRSEHAGFTLDRGRLVMAAILQSETRRLDALFAHNDDMALGAIRAIEDAGRLPGRNFPIVSVDATRAAFDAMIAGKLNATVECNPLLGAQLMTAVTEVMAGRDIPAHAVVSGQVFTTQNAKQFIQSRKY